MNSDEMLSLPFYQPAPGEDPIQTLINELGVASAVELKPDLSVAQILGIAAGELTIVNMPRAGSSETHPMLVSIIQRGEGFV